MDDSKSFSTTAELSTLPDLPRERREPDVPQNIVMDHLNDPNYDLVAPHQSLDSLSHKKRAGYSAGASDFDSESHFGSEGRSPSRASRDSTALEFDDESPYPEVRASVASVDDPSIPVNTFRTWFLGIFFTILVSGLNQVFAFRYPSVLITGIVAQLVALPLGKGLERILPTTRFRTFGRVWSLNPGPFNIKEHVCITVMANVVVSGAYATDVIATQRIFYNETVPLSYQITLVLSTQILGFSLGGLLRPFVVWPSSMIWPGSLVNCALFNTLHKTYGKREHGHMSRQRFFCYVFVGSFLYYWLPGYLFTALSVFNWVCWIAPNNVPVNLLFGTNSGLGMGILTFDWGMISYIGSPLVTPWWSELNTTASLVLFFFIITPILYFTNTFYAKYLPISAHNAFDNTGNPYDPTAIVTDGRFDLAKYQSYSPLFLSTTLVMAYALAFASFMAVFVHTFLWFRRDIARRFRSSLKDERDVHSRLMQVYLEVPGWWYAAVGVISLTMLLVSIEIFPTQLPVWAAFFAFSLAAVLSIPLAMIQAITNQQIGFNVLHEMIAGCILPGRPVANMIFKTIAYIGTNQAVGFSSDLKLGHYMKIPPRMMFMVQMVAAFISCLVCILIQQWMFAHVVDFCHPDQPNGFSCPSTTTFATASLIWGGVGPKRIIGSDGMYSPITYFILLGALLPIPFYCLARRFPLSFWRYVNIPVFFAGVAALPPASGINYASWAITGFIFNYFVRRYHFRWWMRYNYILSAGLDAGVGLGLLVIFFCVQYPKGGFTLNWWGNTVWQNTADAMGTPLYILKPNETFGPTSWH